jgi:hypothetical protein
MTSSAIPRLALALLGRFVPDNEPLAGDLIEEFQREGSHTWLWCQVLAAIATHLLKRSPVIRPLRLVDVQPPDAVERSQQVDRRDRSVNLSASPVSGVGGLGLASLAMFVTCVVPHAWWALLASAGRSFAWRGDDRDAATVAGSAAHDPTRRCHSLKL